MPTRCLPACLQMEPAVSSCLLSAYAALREADTGNAYAHIDKGYQYALAKWWQVSRHDGSMIIWLPTQIMCYMRCNADTPPPSKCPPYSPLILSRALPFSHTHTPPMPMCPSLQLPEQGTSCHLGLLQTFQQLVELRESGRVLADVMSAGQRPDAHYNDTREILETWRHAHTHSHTCMG
jgi:hypothetical protein